MDVLVQNTYKRRYSDKGCDFFLKNIIFTKKMPFFTKKSCFLPFFLKKGQCFEKNRVLKKAEGN